MRMFFLYTILLFASVNTFSQGTPEEEKVKVVGETSSTPGYILEDVVITADNSEYMKKYRNAKYFIRRVYAYAELASNMLNEYRDTLTTMSSKRKQKQFLKHANKELKEEFGDEIKEMSVTRGRYLNKLIYRDAGISTYDIIKDYRGGFQAVFWQSLCRLNGQNLKVSYDPDGEDRVIEQVVQEIESGKIKIIPRPAKSEKGKEVEKRNRKKKRKLRKEAAVASH